MARRMFSSAIVESSAFMEMPLSTQALYFHLGMNADDDGFVGNAKIILRMCGAAEDDMRLLLAKRFILSFENGVVVVKHWKINNYIRQDRYHPTVYQDEKQMLFLKSNQAYSDHPQPSLSAQNKACLTSGIPTGIPSDNQAVYQRSTEVGKVDKTSINNNILLDRAERKIAFTLPLNTGESFQIYQDDVDKWAGLYPAVDVMQQLRNMYGWLDSNPSKRKTKNGIRRFIANWLSREQDRGGYRGKPGSNASIPSPQSDPITTMSKEELDKLFGR